ncbi:c-type cytochrome [Aquirufa salirivi]|uniref:C-type cytochrome n=1 Tax=Aquirufa salirivi TaxID=3104729 RepID=A0ABW8RY99_9BACT
MKMRPLVKLGMVFAAVIALGSFGYNSLHKVQPALAEGANPKTDKIRLQPGFKIEHLFSPSDAKMGSWVAMTFDDKGRMICSDQYGGLFRLTIPAIGSKDTTPKIEKLKFGKGVDTLGIGNAHGLLYAFNSLYVMVNARVAPVNPPAQQAGRNANFAPSYAPRGSGLYRVQDLDGDDHFDKITLLKEFKGEGEHGPHSIVLSPDKKSLYLVAGNHTDVPPMDAYRLPKNWFEDSIYPLIKDPRGHANDRYAPGGWIANIDPEGKKWELVSAGYRNTYDITFNENGDLFAYDSDMEWEFGLPWYRPTRICHVTSGSEFGWRQADSKWPVTHPDNLPPVLNIGQGSPTSLLSLKDAKFPAKYKKSLIGFDWTFGIAHLIKLKPQGSSYVADHEEFLSGIPLPLTDGTVGPDGALYFMIGGRRLESDVYRVYYAGPEEASVKPIVTPINALNETRRKIETFHQGPNPAAVAFVWPYLKHPDRFIRYAARMALEHQPINEWKDKALTEKDPIAATHALLALIRQSKPELKAPIYAALLAIDNKKFNESQQLDILRTIELAMLRLGMPDAAVSAKLVANYNPLYPSNKRNLDRALSRLLIPLEAPNVIERTLKIMDTKDTAAVNVYRQETATASADLIMRNPQYGTDIAKMLEKIPPAQQTYMAIMLTAAKTNWTPEQHERYFKWIKNALEFSGGRSYVGFIDRARKLALKNVPDAKRAYYDKLGGADLLTSNGNDIAKFNYPKGPGKNWKLEDAVAILDAPLVNRDFQNGKSMFAAATCVRCHALGSEGGGSVGPDLTNLGTRFSKKDMLESIIDPSKTISDQYAATQLMLRNRTSIVGRLVNQDKTAYYISQNPYDPDQVEKILKKNVISMKYSALSSMLPGLINSMNAEELKDLMAYLMSGGSESNAMFAKPAAK